MPVGDGARLSQRGQCERGVIYITNIIVWQYICRNYMCKSRSGRPAKRSQPCDQLRAADRLSETCAQVVRMQRESASDSGAGLPSAGIAGGVVLSQGRGERPAYAKLQRSGWTRNDLAERVRDSNPPVGTVLVPDPCAQPGRHPTVTRGRYGGSGRYEG